MPDPTDDAVIAGLWLVAAAAFVWLWVPRLAGACGWSVYANGGTEDPAGAEPDGTNPPYADLFDDLAALGYQPLGVGFMRVRFYLGYWAYRTRVRAFRSAAAGTFAFVQDGPIYPRFHEVYFATVFRDGRLVLTAGGLAEGRVELPGFEVGTHATFRPDELAARHRAAAADAERRGWRPDPDLSLANLLRATAAHAGEGGGPLRALDRKELVVAAVLLGLTAGFTWLAGPRHWLGPFVGLLGTFFYLCVYTAVRLANAAKLRRLWRQEREGDRGEEDPGW